MVVDVVGNGSAITSSSQTLQWVKNQNSSTAHGNGAQSTAVGASSVTMGYTVTADWWGIIGADVVAAPSLTVPAAPTNVVATGGNGQVGLSWSASSGASSYNVKRSMTSGGPYTTIASPTTTSYTDTGVTNGTTYYYVVTAVNTAGESGNSSEVSATPQVAVPAAPTNVTATGGNGQVVLSWSASIGASSYNVQRSTTSGGPYTTIASPTTTSYTDTGVTNGTTYYYVIAAVNAVGPSANSSQVSATPSASVALDSSALGQGALGASSLSWSHTVGSGSNRALVVGVVGACVPSVTYGGVALTHAGQVYNDNHAPSSTDLFVLVAPATGTNTVQVS
jgi:cellulose 1,4-beta-cellobiosidase